MFDPAEFLTPYGIRSLSKAYTEPAHFEVNGQTTSIKYEPGESRTGMFGGNSNWRGPVWFPVNVLLADKLRTYGRHFRDTFTVEIPTGSGQLRTLTEAADLIDGGLTALFRTVDGRRPSDGQRIDPARTRCGPSIRPSASSSTVTPARAWGPPTRPVGLPWWPTCSTRGCPRTRGRRAGPERHGGRVCRDCVGCEP